jgi:hypothetical protein
MPTGSMPRNGSAASRWPSSWPAPPRSAGPMRWSRWPPAPALHRPAAAGPSRCSRCELWNRTTLTPGTAAAHLSEADIERVVFDSPSRVIDVGAKRRFFQGALRRAIEVRDRTCFHPLCDEVPDHPEIDHVHESGKGGETTQSNGRLACGFHNRWRNSHPDPCHDVSPDLGDPHAGPDPPEH